MRDEPDRPADDETTARPPLVEDSFAPPAADQPEPDPFVRGAAVGRYVLLDRIGAGGMGHVFAAYDPELDRKVAVKLVRVGGFAGELRLLREAQALARLAHPNVVAIHDVGVQVDHVWLAMEFVAGETLGVWARTRRHWRANLDVLLPIARGVAAAHAAGLVHRDLKPGNVMVSPDGRVRVMDFGLVHDHDAPPPADEPLAAPAVPREQLAEAALTRSGDILGTPAYMAPEQWRGDPAAAAADQFGWCVMAWELLHGERPFAGDEQDSLREAVLAGRRRPPPHGRRVPAWVRRVLERGLAVDPRERWPDMAALVSALERGQSQARRRVALALLLALAAAVGLAFGLQRWRVARQVAACEAAGAEIEALWTDEVRETVRAAFIATGLDYAASSAERVVPWIDESIAAWRAARTELCMRVEVHRTWGDELRDRGLSCLADRRLGLETLLSEFASAGPTDVQRAIDAVAVPRFVSDCLDADILRRQPVPPADADEAIRDIRALLKQAYTLAATGDPRGALAVATRADESAAALGWLPIRTETQVMLAGMLRVTGAPAEGRAMVAEAYFAASAAGDWSAAAVAATERIGDTNDRRGIETSRTWARLAETALVHIGDPHRLREAVILNKLAIVEGNAGAHAEAKQLYRRVLDIREAALPAGHPQIAAALHNLGIAEFKLGSSDAARGLFQRALAIQEPALGPYHPNVVESLNSLAAVAFEVGDHAGARALITRTLAARRRIHGDVHMLVARDLANLAELMMLSGDLAQARPLLAENLAICEQLLAPDDPEIAMALDLLASLLRLQGDVAGARASAQRALAIREKAKDPEQPDYARTLANLADLHLDEGATAAARPLYVRALAIQDKALGPDHPEVAARVAQLAALELAEDHAGAALPLLERAVAIFDAHPGTQTGELYARHDLVKALARTGGDPARTLALARDVRDGLRADPLATKRLAELERWLAEHDPPAPADPP